MRFFILMFVLTGWAGAADSVSKPVYDTKAGVVSITITADVSNVAAQIAQIPDALPTASAAEKASVAATKARMEAQLLFARLTDVLNKAAEASQFTSVQIDAEITAAKAALDARAATLKANQVGITKQ